MKTPKILAFALATLVIASCSKEGSDPGPGKQGVPTNATIHVLDKGSYALDGEVEGTAEESKINVLEFYVFGDDNNPDTNLEWTDGGVTHKGYYKLTSFQNEVRLGINSGNNVKFVVLANTNVGPTTDNYSTFIGKLSSGQFVATATEYNTRAIPATGLEMSGKTIKAISDKTNTVVPVYIDRMASKIETPTFDSSNPTFIDLPQEDIDDLWGESANVTNNDITWEFKGHVVVNGLDKSDRLFVSTTDGIDTDPRNNPWTNWSRTGKTYLLSDFEGSGYYKLNYSGFEYRNAADSVDKWFIPTTDTKPVFLYENSPISKAAPGHTSYENNTMVAIMLHGTLTANGTTLDRYWRVNVTKDELYHVLRNCVYRTKVSAIKSKGFDTPKEGENPGGETPDPDNTTVDVKITVNKWRLKEYVTEI